MDWVLSLWAHLTVPRFICVYVCVILSHYIDYMRCIIVTQWGGPGVIEAIILRTFLQCFDTGGWVI